MVKKCAVIWCEDHRSLAYFNGATDACEARLRLGPGDLVEFDVEEDGDLRIALRPSVVAQEHYISLPDDLMRATSLDQTSDQPCTCVTYKKTDCGHVLPFPGAADGNKCSNAFACETGRKAS